MPVFLPNNVRDRAPAPVPTDPIRVTYEGDNVSFDKCERVYFFSDEEGTAPFDFEDRQTYEGVKHTQMDGLTEMNVRTELGEGLIFHENIISDLRPKTGLVFLGDLIDHGPNEIKLLKKMVELKDKYPNRVCLIAGNRDINKLRMSDELLIVDKDGENVMESRWLHSIGTLKTLAQSVSRYWKDIDLGYKFKNSGLEERFRYENDEAKLSMRWNDSESKKNLTEVQTPTQRVSQLFNKTLGASKALENKMDEMGCEGLSYDEKSVFMCLINTLMCGSCITPPGDSELFALHGLYLKYLQKSDVLRLIKVGEKNVLVSHAGVPDSLSCPLGAPVVEDGTRDAKLFTTIGCINKLFKSDVGKILEYNNTGKTDNKEVLDLIQKYVFHSAGNNKWKEFNTDTNSPIVAHNANPEGDMWAGGEPPWYKDEAVFMTYPKQDSDLIYGKKEVVHYSVYGHRPQGAAPSVWKLKDDKTTYICIDVSKAPGQIYDPNKTEKIHETMQYVGIPLPDYNVFAMFVLKKDGDAKIIGRAFLDTTEKGVNKVGKLDMIIFEVSQVENSKIWDQEKTKFDSTMWEQEKKKFDFKMRDQNKKNFNPEIFYVNTIEDYTTFEDKPTLYTVIDNKTNKYVTEYISLKYKFRLLGYPLRIGTSSMRENFYEITETRQAPLEKFHRRLHGGSRVAPLLAPVVGLLCAALASVFL